MANGVGIFEVAEHLVSCIITNIGISAHNNQLY
jgi:hypothetical protein